MHLEIRSVGNNEREDLGASVAGRLRRPGHEVHAVGQGEDEGEEAGYEEYNDEGREEIPELDAMEAEAMAATQRNRHNIAEFKKARGYFSRLGLTTRTLEERRARARALMAEAPCRACDQSEHWPRDPECPKLNSRLTGGYPAHQVEVTLEVGGYTPRFAELQTLLAQRQPVSGRQDRGEGLEDGPAAGMGQEAARARATGRRGGARTVMVVGGGKWGYSWARRKGDLELTKVAIARS